MRQMALSHTKLTVWFYWVQSLLDAQHGLALSPLPLHVLVGQVALKIPHAEGSEQGPPCSHRVPPCGWVLNLFRIHWAGLFHLPLRAG